MEGMLFQQLIVLILKNLNKLYRGIRFLKFITVSQENESIKIHKKIHINTQENAPVKAVLQEM